MRTPDAVGLTRTRRPAEHVLVEGDTEALAEAVEDGAGAHENGSGVDHRRFDAAPAEAGQERNLLRVSELLGSRVGDDLDVRGDDLARIADEKAVDDRIRPGHVISGKDVV